MRAGWRGIGGRPQTAYGPYLYVERGGFMLHLWLRWFRLPWQHGLRWGYTLRLGGRYVLFGGRR